MAVLPAAICAIGHSHKITMLIISDNGVSIYVGIFTPPMSLAKYKSKL